MLPNGFDPPLKMLATVQKVRATERMLQDLTQCDRSIEIPGNFRALQRRRKHDDSKLVFPEPKGRKKESFETHYTLNFKKHSNGKPSKERPCSPTRRNNPHPSKNFLTWRIPTRVFDYGKSKNANVNFLNSNIDDTFQSFYHDYSGKRNEPVNQNEVNTKMLLEMTKSYSGAANKKVKKRAQKIHFLNGEGSTNPPISLPSLLRNSWSPDQSSLGLPKRKDHTKALSPLFVNEDIQPLFQSWYDAASAKDKANNGTKAGNVIADMEESYIKKALENALQPDAIEAIEDWLLEADDDEREIAMQFIQTIILASIQKQRQNTVAGTQTENVRRQLTPMIPAPNRMLTPPSTKPKHSHHHNHTKGCDVCSKKNLESALQHLQAVASAPHELPGITELMNPLHPGVLANKEKRKLFSGNNRRKLCRPQRGTATIDHGKNGSLFVASQQPTGRHFTIHPEWF